MDSENNIFLRSHAGDVEIGQQGEGGDLVPQENINNGIFREPFNGRVGEGWMEEPRRQQTIWQQTSSAERDLAVWTRRVVFVVLASCILYVIIDSFGDRRVEAALLQFLQWVKEHPFQGTAAVTVVYIVATVLFVPGSILSFGAGFAIGNAFQNTTAGVLLATTAVFIGASIGSIFSFLLGRYLFRDWVLRLAATYAIFQAIDRALEGNGLKIMVLLRLSPLIPYNALDYMSGVTSISLRDYTLALIALLPGALMLCFVGASASSLTDTTSIENKTVKIITIASGILFGGLGVFAASYYSKQELDRILASYSPGVLIDDEGSTELLVDPPESPVVAMSVRRDGHDGDGYPGEA